jgi:hypothetical protein
MAASALKSKAAVMARVLPHMIPDGKVESTNMCGFDTLTGLNFNKRPIKEGGKLIENQENSEGHLRNVMWIDYKNKENMSLIIAECLPQMKLRENEDYLITFNVIKSDQPYVHQVVKTHCSCPSGNGFKTKGYCKHVQALYTWINKERGESKTDEKQTWHTHSEHLQNAYPHVRMNNFCPVHFKTLK